MQVMGTNRWESSIDAHSLMTHALAFADQVREQGIAELHGAWIAENENLMWCTWDTDNLDMLQSAFDEMNRTTGLTSKLTVVDTFYSTVQDTVAV